MTYYILPLPYRVISTLEDIYKVDNDNQLFNENDIYRVTNIVTKEYHYLYDEISIFEDFDDYYCIHIQDFGIMYEIFLDQDDEVIKFTKLHNKYNGIVKHIIDNWNDI